MQVNDLENALATIRDMYVASGAKIPARDFDALLELVRASSATSVDEFVDETLELLAAPKSTLSNLNVGRHLEALQRAGLNKEKFARAKSDLESDKSLKNADIAAIGAAYTEFSKFGSLYKTRKKMLEQIQSSFRDRINFESKRSVIANTAVW